MAVLQEGPSQLQGVAPILDQPQRNHSQARACLKAGPHKQSPTEQDCLLPPTSLSLSWRPTLGLRVTDPWFCMGGFDLYPKHSSSHISKHPEPSFWATTEHIRVWETVVGTGEAATKPVHWVQCLLTAGLV